MGNIDYEKIIKEIRDILDNKDIPDNKDILDKYFVNEKIYLAQADTEKYGQMITKLRTEKGSERTLQNLADGLGITKQALSAIENGKRKKINPVILLHLSEIFKCSTDYLLGYTEEKAQAYSMVEKYLVAKGLKDSLPIPKEIVAKHSDLCNRLTLPFLFSETDKIERGKKQLERIDKDLLDLLLVCSEMSASKRTHIKTILSEAIKLGGKYFVDKVDKY